MLYLYISYHNIFLIIISLQMSKKITPSYGTKSDGDPKLGKINETLVEIKGTMFDNMGRVIDRGERIDNLLDKSEELNRHATLFAKKSRCMKLKTQCDNYKKNILIFSFVAAIFTILMCIIYYGSK